MIDVVGEFVRLNRGSGMSRLCSGAHLVFLWLSNMEYGIWSWMFLLLQVLAFLLLRCPIMLNIRLKEVILLDHIASLRSCLMVCLLIQLFNCEMQVFQSNCGNIYGGFIGILFGRWLSL